MDEEIRTYPVFLAMTRVPTLLGVGYSYFVLISIVTAILFINLQSFKVLGFFALAYMLGYLVCFKNPFQFIEIAQWLVIFREQRNRSIWKSNSYSEIP